MRPTSRSSGPLPRRRWTARGRAAALSSTTGPGSCSMARSSVRLLLSIPLDLSCPLSYCTLAPFRSFARSLFPFALFGLPIIYISIVTPWVAPSARGSSYVPLQKEKQLRETAARSHDLRAELSLQGFDPATCSQSSSPPFLPPLPANLPCAHLQRNTPRLQQPSQARSGHRRWPCSNFLYSRSGLCAAGQSQAFLDWDGSVTHSSPTSSMTTSVDLPSLARCLSSQL